MLSGAEGLPDPYSQVVPDHLRRWSVRPLLLLPVALVAVVSVLGVLLLAGPGRTPAPRTAAGGLPPDAAAQRRDLVADLLDRRAAAVLHHDRPGFLATVDPGNVPFLATQGALFDNLQGVPLESWAYAVDASRVQPGSTALDRRYGTWWAPRVVLSTVLLGVDAAPSTAALHPTFVLRGRQWFLAAEDDFAAEPNSRAIWDAGPVVTARGARSLILGHPGAEPELRRLAGEADVALASATQALGAEAPVSAVLVLPQDPAELAALAGTGQSVERLAAIAVGGPGPGGDRVLVNAAAFAQLGPTARRVVLTHELVHVAMRPRTSGETPTWLSEGLADHVAYAGAGIPVADALSALRAEVRAGRLPADLPADAAFGGDSPTLTVSYDGARLAYEVLVTLRGETGALAAYRAVGRGVPLDQAFGLPLPEFVAAWHDAMRQQLS
ncbi:MAG: lipoprotein [Frankiales bacterium]|nr:lipoprotein [Frankiales bacterium]